MTSPTPSAGHAPLHFNRAVLGVVISAPVLLMASVALTGVFVERQLLTTILDAQLAMVGLVAGLSLELILLIFSMERLSRGRHLWVVGPLNLLASVVGLAWAGLLTLLWSTEWTALYLICGFAWSECQIDLWSPFFRLALWGLVMVGYLFRGLGWPLLVWRYGRKAPAAGQSS